MSEKSKETARIILEMLAEGGRSAWLSLNRAEVVAGALARIDDPNKVDQGKADLCGLACFVRSLAADAPDEYASAIRGLFEYGTAFIGHLGHHYTVKPCLG